MKRSERRSRDMIVAVILTWIAWFFFTALLTLGVKFCGTVLLAYTFTYRIVFWPVFILGGAILALIEIVFGFWIEEYKMQLTLGKARMASFDFACEKIKFRPPKFLLRVMEPALFWAALHYRVHFTRLT